MAEGATRSNTEARGAGLGDVVKGGAAESAKRSNTEARGAGLGVVVKGGAAEGAKRSNTEARGAGLGGVVKRGAAEGATRREGRGETEKVGGKYQDQDTGGSDGRYAYPLVVPRLEEVRDDSTLVQCTGTNCSTVHYHGVMVNTPYPQHLEGGDGTDIGSDTHDDTHHGRLARDDTHHDLHARDLAREYEVAGAGPKPPLGDHGAEETDIVNFTERPPSHEVETKGKEEAKGIVSRYKRPVFTRYQEEGTDPHRKRPTRNGVFRGDKEDASIETLTGTLQGKVDNSTKNHTGVLTRNRDRMDASTKTLTEGNDNTKDLTGTLKTLNGTLQGKVDNSTKTLTGVLKNLTGTLHGERDNSTKTHTEVHTRDRDKRDGSTKTLTGVLKTLTGTLHGGEDNSTKSPKSPKTPKSPEYRVHTKLCTLNRAH